MYHSWKPITAANEFHEYFYNKAATASAGMFILEKAAANPFYKLPIACQAC